MIASLAFEPRLARVRRAHFERRPNVPLDAACVLANGVREGLRTVLGEPCAVTLGEPVALEGPAWRALLCEALAFVVPGRATDVAYVLSRRDARALIQAAFGEAAAPYDGSWSALEIGAVERIVTRCANASEVLCVERRGPLRALDPARLPPCAGFFDVRVAGPIAITLGVAVTRELPPPVPTAALSAAALGRLPLDLRVTLGDTVVVAPRLLELRVGDVVPLRTKVDGMGELKVDGQRVAQGICGVVAGHAAFEVRSCITRGDAL